jgi:hypothetical protein
VQRYFALQVNDTKASPPSASFSSYDEWQGYVIFSFINLNLEKGLPLTGQAFFFLTSLI